MDAKLKKELQELQKDIREHADYLYRCTYHPYDTIEDFARRLAKIIEENDKPSYWID